MVDLTREKSIGNVLIASFQKGGWKHQKNDKIHGVDIKLWHPTHRRYWFIEVKRKYTSRNKSSKTYVNTATAIGQIIYRMHQRKAGFYGIAAPDIRLFRNELSKIPLWIKKTLKLYIFLVDRNGGIRKITPSQGI